MPRPRAPKAKQPRAKTAARREPLRKTDLDRETAKKTEKGPARARKDDAERVQMSGLRTLGDVEPGARKPKKRSSEQEALATKALAILQQEFDNALALKEKLAAEAKIGGAEKGRESLRQPEKLRSLVASLEGMSRFALEMGLITPAEGRELYAAAMKRGLYHGWR
jgi:hypothetical protein